MPPTGGGPPCCAGVAYDALGGTADGRGAAIGGMAIGLGGTEPGAPGVGFHRGGVLAPYGDGCELCGNGAAVDGAENIWVNSPGPLAAGFADGGGAGANIGGATGGTDA